MFIDLVDGQPIRFGADGEFGVMLNNGTASVVNVDDVGIDSIAVHNESDPSPTVAFALSELAKDRQSPTVFGVLRAVDVAEYSQSINDQVVAANAAKGPGDLSELLRSGATWEV